MKTFGEGHILRSGLVTVEECLRYAMSLPVDVTVVDATPWPGWSRPWPWPTPSSR